MKIMGKYMLFIGARMIDDVDSDFLPREGDGIEYQGGYYAVRKVVHEIFKKREYGMNFLEAIVRVEVDDLSKKPIEPNCV